MEGYDFELDEQIIRSARTDPSGTLKDALALADRFPNFDKSWATLSFVYYINMRINDAIETINMATKIAPEEAANFFSLARLYFENGTYDLAIENFDMCVLLSRNNENNFYISICNLYISYCFYKFEKCDIAISLLEHVNEEDMIWVGELVGKDDILRLCS